MCLDHMLQIKRRQNIAIGDDERIVETIAHQGERPGCPQWLILKTVIDMQPKTRAILEKRS